MEQRHSGRTVSAMPEHDETALCEHGLPPEECVVCRTEDPDWNDSIFDVEAWAEAYGDALASAHRPPAAV